MTDKRYGEPVHCEKCGGNLVTNNCTCRWKGMDKPYCPLINEDVEQCLYNKQLQDRIKVLEEATHKIRELLGDFQVPWTNRETFIDKILKEALKQD